MAAQPIVHVEIPAKDTAATAKFYADAFGWELEHAPNFDYWMFRPASGGPGGGFVSTDPSTENPYPPKPSEVLIYINSDDIDADLAKIESLGGKSLGPKMEIPQTGWFAVFTDPAGNKVALYKAMQPAGG
ncbi:MAG: VOC family protein [Chloroflexia bacterium]